jgi:sulfate/thiosulfate transport system permease protein
VRGGGPAGAGSPAAGPWARRLLIGVAAVYMGVLILLPLGALAAGALAEGPARLLRGLATPDVARGFALTLRIGLVTVAIHAVFGTALAWVLVRHEFAGRSLVNALIDLPFAVSPVVAGYMLLLLFGRQGLLAPLVEATGIQVAFAVPGMVLATLFVTLPFMARELVPVLQAFDQEQEGAASTLGAGGWQTFRLVTVPALKWGFIYGMILTFARALGEFGAVLVVSGGVKGRTETATLFIYRALDERQYVEAYGAALLLGLISLTLVLGTELFRRTRR